MAGNTGIQADVNAGMAPHTTFTLRVRTDPFAEHAWKDSEHLLGLSIADALQERGLPNDDSVQVLVQGTPIPPAWRSRTRVHESRVVHVETTPGAAVPIVTAAASAFGVTLSLTAGGLWAGLFAGAILWDARAILNDLFGIGGAPQGDPLRDIRLSGRNQAYPYDPVPVVLGRRRYTPPLAMQPHTELVQGGNDAYLNTMLAWGHAPMTVDDIQIGTDPLSSFEKTTAQHDFDGDGGIKFAPRQDERRLDTALKADWTEFQTEARANYISISFKARITATTRTSEEARSGTIYDTTYHVYHRSVEVEYRKQGDSTWRPGGSATLGDTTSYTIYGRRGGTPRTVSSASVSIDGGPDPADSNRRLPLESGLYEVRMRQSALTGSPPSNASLNSGDIRVSNFGSRLLETPVQVSGVALSAFRVFVPSGESTNVDQINGICGQKILKYQASSGRWGSDRTKDAEFGTSTNPADIFRAVLTSEDINARPLPQGFVDDDNLAEWWRFCDAEGFGYSKVIDGTETRQDLLSEIAKAGRALPRMSGGKWGVAINRPQPGPTQLFTPANSDNFLQQTAMPQFPHALRVPFDNEDADWEADERLVYDDGYGPRAEGTTKKADQFQVLNIPGVTNAAAAYKLARYVLATMRLRPRTMTLDVGYKFLKAEIGDWVQVAHDAALVGQSYGWIEAVEGGADYDAWSVRSYTPDLDDFDAFDPPDAPRVGLFKAGSTDAPLGWDHDGAYGTRLSADRLTQWVMTAFGDDGQGRQVAHPRQRGRTTGTAWDDDWSTDTAFFEEDDADRVTGNSEQPSLIRLGHARNTPAAIKPRLERHDRGRHGRSWPTRPPGRSPTARTSINHTTGGACGTGASGTCAQGSVQHHAQRARHFRARAHVRADGPAGQRSDGDVPGDEPQRDRPLHAHRGGGEGPGRAGGHALRLRWRAGLHRGGHRAVGGECRAALTLLPYAPAVFDAAKTIPDYTTSISKPVGPTFTGPPTPEIVSIESDEDALPVDRKGTPTPTIKLTVRQGIAPPLNGKVTQPVQTRIRWRRAATRDAPAGDWSVERIGAEETVAYLMPVDAHEEYEIEVRAEDASRGFSRPAEARHRVLGLGAPPSRPDNLEVKTANGATTLHWRHDDPERDIIGYAFWWSPRSGVRQVDKMVRLDVQTAANDRAVPVQPYYGSFAVKAIDVTGTFSASATYADSAVTTPPVDVEIVRTLQESPSFSGTKDKTAVRNSTLELERVTLQADDPTFTERDANYPGGIDDWPYIDRPAGTTIVRREGTYTSSQVDLSGIFSVLVTEDFVIGNPVNVAAQDMASTDDMSQISDMSGGIGESVTTVTTQFRFGDTQAEMNWRRNGARSRRRPSRRGSSSSACS